MKVYVKDIGPQGLSLEDELSSEYIGLNEDDYLRFIQPIKVHVKLDRVDDYVLCKAKVSSRYRSVCCRSLVPVERDWTEEILLDFPVDNETLFIELDEDIRQEIIISLPMRILSDGEMAKEELIGPDEEENRVNLRRDLRTYQPFAALKDIETNE